MDKIYPFAKTLDELSKQVKKLNKSVQDTKTMYSFGNMQFVYRDALRVAQEAEKVTLTARALPAYTGNPNACEDISDMIAETIPVDIGYTKEGWFSLRIPLLLPKKESGSASYIRSFLYPAMKDFFKDQPPVRYSDCVLIYRHVYSKERPDRQKRDHDNIEINMVSDIVALFTMADDSPAVCRHYYCSAKASEERTEVYVVPFSDFLCWLNEEKIMPDEGVLLMQNNPVTHKKDISKT